MQTEDRVSDRIRGRKAIVVGGTHGMGLATAKKLLERGAEVLLTGRDEGNCARVQASLDARARVVRSDVSSMAEIDALGQRVEETLGEIDALFVFAGVAEFAPFHEVSEASFDLHFAVNTKGAFFTVQRLSPLLRDAGSITMATVTPATASPTMGVYMATKAAVRAFARVMAAELLPRRVRVNTLAPGFIDTPTLGVAGLSPAKREELRTLGDRVTPMRRHGTSDEVADAALFLAFDATFSTGIELPVDGGLSEVDAPWG